MSRIAVVGAGIIGLSTAVSIQALIPGSNVVIIAEYVSPYTTSDGASGIFVPSSEKIPQLDPLKFQRWCECSFDYYDELARSDQAGETGICVISGYNLYNRPVHPPSCKPLLYQCRQCTTRELQSLPKKYPFGWYITTLLIDCRQYLPWLTKRFKENGGQIETRRLETLEELAGQFDAVVNCSGFGSKHLVSDSSVYPIRGQVIRVSAPWIKHFYRDPENLVSVTPGYDSVFLGTPKQEGDDYLELRPEDASAVMQNCTEMVPSLKSAKVLYHWVGLRPGRHEPRLEEEVVYYGKTVLKVVHNYGHGSLGVSLSWGMAQEAARMTRNLLQGTPVKHKL